MIPTYATRKKRNPFFKKFYRFSTILPHIRIKSIGLYSLVNVQFLILLVRIKNRKNWNFMEFLELDDCFFRNHMIRYDCEAETDVPYSSFSVGECVGSANWNAFSFFIFPCSPREPIPVYCPRPMLDLRTLSP